jgi:flavodoxin
MEAALLKKVLIVCYSRTGITKMVMEELAKHFNGDVEVLIDKKKRSGVIGYIIAAKDAVKKVKAQIQPVKYNSEEYDLVIIGTPVWAATMASAVRTYIDEYKEKFKAVAFVATQGGKTMPKVFEDMAALSGMPAIAQFDVSGSEIKKGLWTVKVKDFADIVRREA